MLISDIYNLADLLIGELWPIGLLFFVLLVVETLLSVSLCVVEDFNENDLEAIESRLSTSNIQSLKRFL